MHQHLISHPGLGQAGQAHLLTHPPEIHLRLAPERLISICNRRLRGDGKDPSSDGQAHGGINGLCFGYRPNAAA